MILPVVLIVQAAMEAYLFHIFCLRQLSHCIYSQEVGGGWDHKEVTQWLRAFAAFPEDPDLIPSTHKVAHTIRNSSSGGLTILFWLLQTLSLHVEKTPIHRQRGIKAFNLLSPFSAV